MHWEGLEPSQFFPSPPPPCLRPVQRQLPLSRDSGLWLGRVTGQGQNTMFPEEMHFLHWLCVVGGFPRGQATEMEASVRQTWGCS